MSDQFFMMRHEERETWGEEDLLDSQGLAHATGLPPRLLTRLCELGIVDSVQERHGEPMFAVDAVPRLRRVLRLRRDLGLSWNSLGLVADLLERIEVLESRLRQREAIGR